MASRNWAADQFEANRPQLRACARRLLGSDSEADDAVQEAWLRFDRVDAETIDNPAAWLTTVVARICLSMLRSRKVLLELPADDQEAPPVDDGDTGDPERQAVVADQVGLAMLVVIEELSPAERVAFVLHDVFDLPFDQVSVIMDRSPAATRQLASRARRRVRGSGGYGAADVARGRRVVGAFLAASRSGDFPALMSVLDPRAEAVSDEAAVLMGSPALVSGASDVAKLFSGRAQGARLALVDGVPAAVWMRGGTPKVAFLFTIEGDHVLGIRLVADAQQLAAADIDLAKPSDAIVAGAEREPWFALDVDLLAHGDWLAERVTGAVT